MNLNRRLLCFALLSVSVSLTLPAQTRGSLQTTSLLGQKLYAQADDGSIAAARSKLASGPPSVPDYLALSKAEAGRSNTRRR